MEEVALRLLPFLATAALALLQFYLLHGGDELVGLVLVDGLLLKELVVQNFSVSKKMGEPKTVGKAAHYEYGKDGKVVERQYRTKYHKADAGEHHAEGLIGEERLHTAVCSRGRSARGNAGSDPRVYLRCFRLSILRM